MELSVDTIVKLNEEIDELLENYRDIPVEDLISQMNISSGAKNKLNALTRRFIAYTDMKTLIQLEDSDKLSIKTVKLDKYGKLKESMSFPAFKYCDLLEENWESSSLRNCFHNHLFAFTVFQDRGKKLYLKKIVLWEMPDDVLENSVKSVWEKMRELLRAGDIVKYIDNNGHYFSFFPASTDNPYVHVRPHAKDRNDTNKLPVQDKLTGLIEYPKHCFWLNRSYILKIIS